MVREAVLFCCFVSLLGQVSKEEMSKFKEWDSLRAKNHWIVLWCQSMGEKTRFGFLSINIKYIFGWFELLGDDSILKCGHARSVLYA